MYYEKNEQKFNNGKIYWADAYNPTAADGKLVSACLERVTSTMKTRKDITEKLREPTR